ncbi:MAG: hypothetical protein WC464_04430 [Bdellovibrionales bacterium]
MGRFLTLDELRSQIDLSRERLARERGEILSLAPLPDGYNRDTYSFYYVRAERLGLNAITARLNEVSWLPMHIDPGEEFLLEDRTSIKKWLSSPAASKPDSSCFGNDFAHALTRVALAYGWESAEFSSAASRVGALFHDLSCLIGLIYYGVWMAENGILGVPTTDPTNLGLTAKEVFSVMSSPEVARFIAERERAQARGKHGKKRTSPFLRVIDNVNWDGGPSHHSS